MRCRPCRKVGGRRARVATIACAMVAYTAACASLNQNVDPERGQPPVYNVEFNPTHAGEKATLLDEQPATATWFIDKPSDGSAVERSERDVSGDILRDKDKRLTVTMVCPFCKGSVLSKRLAVYSAAQRRSTRAVFPFTPSKAAGDPSGKLQIGFQVTDDHGVQLDYIAVNVQLVGPGDLPDKIASLKQPALQRAPTIDRDPSARDVDVTLTIQPRGDGRLHATVEGSPDLERAFNGQNRDSARQLKWLGTGMSPNEVPQANGRFYLDLSALINNRPGLSRILSGDPKAAQGNGPNLLLDDDDSAALVKLLFEHGALWHSLLFGGEADSHLREIIKVVEAQTRTDRPIRLRVETAGVYLPWQVLAQPGTKPDATRFWGLRYELSAQPIRYPLLKSFPGPMDYLAGPVVFGQYRSDASNDMVAGLAQRMLDHVRSLFNPSGVLVARSRDEFKDQLDSNKGAVKLILTFTHGKSGTLVSDSGAVSESAAGPELLFANNESLPAATLLMLSAYVPGDQYFFGAAPIVFLNGCETGTGGFFATTNSDFAGLFIRMGARSVIVTEAPVWSFFGYNFGTKLLNAMASGTPITRALLSTRREYFEKSGNPLGLLYSYYGGADASIRVQ